MQKSLKNYKKKKKSVSEGRGEGYIVRKVHRFTDEMRYKVYDIRATDSMSVDVQYFGD